MTESHSIASQASLALATSRIHRSRCLDELQKTFLSVVPTFVNADAYGVYLFDDKLKTQAMFSYQANHKFLCEYESLRDVDPLFERMLEKKSFTHSLEMFGKQEWSRQPLHDFLSRWGLKYSIEAPLVIDGRVKGTLNIARGGDGYFEQHSMASARFLCAEMDAAFKRLCELEELKTRLALSKAPDNSFEGISERAQQVIELAVSGLANRAIADRLGISENTVRHHLKQVYRILGVHNRAELAQRVFNQKIDKALN